MGAAERAAAAAPPPLHPLVERVLAEGAPETLRLSAARGALPIPVADLIGLQVRLLGDAAAAVAGAARESLGRHAPEALAPVLRDPHWEREVLDHFARAGTLPPEVLASVIAHPSVPNATLEELAARGDAATLNLIITNEVRVIAHAPLLAALRGNPKLGGDQRRRLAELERDFIGKAPLTLVTPAADAAPAAGTDAQAPMPEPLEDGTLLPGEEAGSAADNAPDPAAEALAEEALRRTDAFMRIMRLNVAERNLLAMKGNSEERAILIRDTARVVSMAVLKNPRLSDSEITSFAGMRNVHEDILRAIAQNREWTKTYAVVLNLVRNPKTPPGLTVQFLARLGTRDLKITSGDKNIPELVRRNARNLYMARTQPPKKTFKKAH